jgi:hypothetical protein
VPAHQRDPFSSESYFNKKIPQPMTDWAWKDSLIELRWLLNVGMNGAVGDGLCFAFIGFSV